MFVNFAWLTAGAFPVGEPLASNFTYVQTEVNIIVPYVPTAKNYFFVRTSASSFPLTRRRMTDA